MSAITSHLKRAHARQDGSPTIFALVAMVGMILPAFAVMWMASNVSNSSQAAQGIAYSTSYASMTRSFNADATAQSPGGIVLNQNDPAVYEEAEKAVRVGSYIADVGTVNTQMSLVPRPSATPYQPAGDDTGLQRTVGIVNVPASPELNRLFVGGVAHQSTCAGGQQLNGAAGNIAACWTDMRAQNWGSGTYDQANPTGSDGGRSGAWDHYASGAEAEVAFSLPTWMFGDFNASRRGVSSYGRPCAAGAADCTQ